MKKMLYWFVLSGISCVILLLLSIFTEDPLKRISYSILYFGNIYFYIAIGKLL